MRRWPDVLPGASFPGYGLNPTSKVRRSEMEVGEAKVRQVTRARRDASTLTLILTDAEMGAFRSWFDDLPVSLCGDSDDLTTGWTATRMTRALSTVTGPEDCIPTRLTPTTTGGTHFLSRSLATLVSDYEAVVATFSLASAGVTFARITWVDRAGVVKTADVDLSIGAVVGTPGFPVAIEYRSGGFWRVTADLDTGSGALAPELRLQALGPTGGDTFGGDGVAALLVCETMVRRYEGAADRLFIRSGADGRALGAAGGAGWFQMRLALGGGFSVQDCRFVDTFDAQAGANLEWTVKAKVEVRYA